MKCEMAKRAIERAARFKIKFAITFVTTPEMTKSINTRFSSTCEIQVFVSILSRMGCFSEDVISFICHR